MNIKGKNIVITGATSGIGYEMTRQLYLDNKVIVIGRCADKLTALAEEFKGISTFNADLAKLVELETAAVDIVTQFPVIDLLINNAAVQCTPKFIDPAFDYSSIADEITINFTAPCCLIYQLLPALQRSIKATIVNINSGLGLVPKAQSAVYCATKGALNIFSQSLNHQLASTDIDVQQVFLELVETPMSTGRGSHKLSAKDAAEKIITGISQGVKEHDIGKVKLLRLLLRIAPSIARKIMKKY